MHKNICVLVLGVGGNIGQGILKSLAITGITHRVIGACVSPLASGLYTTDSSYVSPYYNDPNFFNWIINVCEKEKVDVILTGVEPVVHFLAKHADQIMHRTNALPLVSHLDQLEIALDKFKTCAWLKENGCHFPHSALSSDAKAVERLVENSHFPLIGKPRYGRGGAGIIEIKDNATLQFALQQDNYLIQEYIGNPDAEFTVGTFSNRDGEMIGIIAMKRELLNGTSYRALVGDFPEIKQEATRIVTQLKPKGPCNLQFRLRENGQPICFEINMRFSGTTPFRSRFGFNEVKASLEHFILGKDITLPVVNEGIALRYWNEVYIDPKAYTELDNNRFLEKPMDYSSIIENYGMKL